MPALQVREFPEGLYEELRLSAKRNHRSIAQQTIVAVQEFVSRDKAAAFLPKKGDANPSEGSFYPTRFEKRRQLFEVLDTLPHIEIPEGFPTSEQIVREIRDQQ